MDLLAVIDGSRKVEDILFADLFCSSVEA